MRTHGLEEVRDLDLVEGAGVHCAGAFIGTFDGLYGVCISYST